MINNEINLDDIHLKYQKLTKFLIDNNLTITTMESCTSGFIASLITDTMGASNIFKGSFVTYNNDAKISCGVDKKIIDKFGVYSTETSLEMAKACKFKYNSNIGIGITGTFANIDVNNFDSISNLVFYTIIYNDLIYNYNINTNECSNRFESKLKVALEVFNSLQTILSF